MGKKLGLGLGFVLADSFSLPFISFFSFIRMEKMGLGLGFDPSSFFFPFSPLSDLRLVFSESDPPFSPSSIPCSVLILGIRVRS